MYFLGWKKQITKIQNAKGESAADKGLKLIFHLADNTQQVWFLCCNEKHLQA